MRNARRAWTALALQAVCGCSHPQSSTSPKASASATATSGAVPGRPAPTQPPVVATPAVTPAPAATAAPSAPPAANRVSAALPPPPKRVPRAAPDAAPQILDVAVSETSVHPGDRVFGRVVTTSNVASVEARIGGYGVSLAKVGVGRFELTYTVAPLPFFVRGNFTMQVIARNTRGDKATREIPLTVR